MAHPSPKLLAFVAVLSLAAPLAGCNGESAPSGSSGGTGAPDAGPTFHYARDGEIRLNQLQVKGTHNSYHVAAADAIKPLAYTHLPLDQQLEKQGVRQIELDTHYNYTKEVYEVYHLGTIDEGTTCRLFADCLKTVKTWSDENPAHQPIFIQIEPKDDPTQDEAEDLFQRLEGDILSVFPRAGVITPDESSSCLDVGRGGVGEIRLGSGGIDLVELA